MVVSSPSVVDMNLGNEKDEGKEVVVEAAVTAALLCCWSIVLHETVNARVSMMDDAIAVKKRRKQRFVEFMKRRKYKVGVLARFIFCLYLIDDCVFNLQNTKSSLNQSTSVVFLSILHVVCEREERDTGRESNKKSVIKCVDRASGCVDGGWWGLFVYYSTYMANTAVQ